MLLIDHCDNCGSGGAQDVMAVVAEILRAGAGRRGDRADPRSRERWRQMIDAGAGQTVALSARRQGPTCRRSDWRGAPLEVAGRVGAITDGEFVITGPMYTGIRTYLGRTAVLEVQRRCIAQIVVTERAHEPFDLGVFTHAGIDPRASAT